MGRKALTTKNFIIQARKLHGDKYDYSKVNYKFTNEDVIIICPIHGEFLKTPNLHLSQGQGCSICSKLNRPKKYFKRVSDETRKKMSESHKGIKQELIRCPHCKKLGGISLLKRYHFDNCKLKVNKLK